MAAPNKLLQLVTTLYGNRMGFNYLGDLVANGKLWQSGLGLDAANTTAAATANTTAIQAALTAGGLVQIMTPGTYYINSTLLIGSDTDFRLGAGVRLKLLGGAGKNMLATTSYAAFTSPTTVTMTWSAGPAASLAWTAHGRVVGDYVWTQGASPSWFNVIGEVITVTDANNIIISLWRTPTGSPTGTVTAGPVVKNVRVSGGTWDYDYPNNQTATSLSRHCLAMHLAQNIVVENIGINNSQGWGLAMFGVRDYRASNISAPTTNQDIVKVTGPALNGRVSQISGKDPDDCVSIMTDSYAAFSTYRITRGDVIDLTVDGIDCETTLSGAGIVVIYPTDVEIMTGIRVLNVTGKGSNAVKMFAYDGAADVIDSIEIDTVNAVCDYPVRMANTGLVVRSMDARNVYVNPISDTTSQAFLQDAGSTLTNGRLHVVCNRTSFGQAGANYLITIGGAYGRFEVSGLVTAGSTGRLAQISATATPGKFVVADLKQTTGDNMVVVVGGGTAGGTYSFENCDSAANSVINASTSCSVQFDSNLFSNASTGVVRTGSTPTIEIRSTGNNRLTSGNWVTVPAGTPVLTIFGWDVTIDPIALTGLATTAQQFLNSNRATAINQGPTVRSAAGWVALGTGAAGVNTVIT